MQAEVPTGVEKIDKAKFKREIARMRRIEGQARGVAKMMEDERYCIDIIHQIAAMEAALKSTRAKLLEIHAVSCIEDAVLSGDPEAQRGKFRELIDLFGKHGG